MEYKIEESNKEYNKYSQYIVKLLDASLKEWEVYIPYIILLLVYFGDILCLIYMIKS